MPRFASFDQRKYRTLPAREGYSKWAATYEDTIKHDMDMWLLEELQTVSWGSVERCADLGCGTGRTAAWLASKGVRAIDGIDATPEMLERARVRNVFTSLNLADVSDTYLPGGTYDLVMMCLVDEHLAELAPLYTEAARIARDGAAFVIIGFHPFFIMAAGMPTHFKDSGGEPVAVETHVHLFSDHAKAAFAAGWQLAEFREQVIDDRWVKIKPTWAAYRDVPVSFACVWAIDLTRRYWRQMRHKSLGEIPTSNRQQDFTCVDRHESLPGPLQTSAPVDQSADQNESERPTNDL